MWLLLVEGRWQSEGHVVMFGCAGNNQLPDVGAGYVCLFSLQKLYQAVGIVYVTDECG